MHASSYIYTDEVDCEHVEPYNSLSFVEFLLILQQDVIV